MKKRIFSLALALMMCLSLTNLAALAAEPQTDSVTLTGSAATLTIDGVLGTTTETLYYWNFSTETIDAEETPVEATVYWVPTEGASMSMTVTDTSNGPHMGLGYDPNDYETRVECVVPGYTSYVYNADAKVYAHSDFGVGYLNLQADGSYVNSLTVEGDGWDGTIHLYSFTTDNAEPVDGIGDVYIGYVSSASGAAMNPITSTTPTPEPTTEPTPEPAPAPALTAAPTAATVLVNGKAVDFDAYSIEGSNYFKLRDLAYILNGGEKQFSVGWDGATQTITLKSGEAYAPVDGDMQSKGDAVQTPVTSTAKVTLDGIEVAFTAYTIGGNNYFKLRDVGQAIDFGVGWDDATKTITIDTSVGYTAE
jgi:hypothetical protein